MTAWRTEYLAIARKQLADAEARLAADNFSVPADELSALIGASAETERQSTINKIANYKRAIAEAESSTDEAFGESWQR